MFEVLRRNTLIVQKEEVQVTMKGRGEGNVCFTWATKGIFAAVLGESPLVQIDHTFLAAATAEDAFKHWPSTCHELRKLQVTECFNDQPTNRPTISDLIEKVKEIEARGFHAQGGLKGILPAGMSESDRSSPPPHRLYR
ncbi:uncharacterized protein [Apostichopus japonicus]|uniref:uncharacterized protein isoform X1 n=1 Tax=Stichopus japonicus TaxID=307972 RepID=UPI003AB29015